MYLPVNPPRVHAPGVGLDSDDGLSHSQIGPSILHHSILFLAHDGRLSESQVFSISEKQNAYKSQWLYRQKQF